MPASRASSSRGRTPVANTTRSTGRFEPSAKSIRLDASAAAGPDLRGRGGGAHRDAELLDQPAQPLTTAVVDLQRHQPRRELDDGGLDAHRGQGAGCLEPEQASADDGTAHGPLQVAGGGPARSSETSSTVR